MKDSGRVVAAVGIRCGDQPCDVVCVRPRLPCVSLRTGRAIRQTGSDDRCPISDHPYDPVLRTRARRRPTATSQSCCSVGAFTVAAFIECRSGSWGGRNATTDGCSGAGRAGTSDGPGTGRPLGGERTEAEAAAECGSGGDRPGDHGRRCDRTGKPSWRSSSVAGPVEAGSSSATTMPPCRVPWCASSQDGRRTTVENVSCYARVDVQGQGEVRSLLPGEALRLVDDVDVVVCGEVFRFPVEDLRCAAATGATAHNGGHRDQRRHPRRTAGPRGMAPGTIPRPVPAPSRPRVATPAGGSMHRRSWSSSDGLGARSIRERLTTNFSRIRKTLGAKHDVTLDSGDELADFAVAQGMGDRQDVEDLKARQQGHGRSLLDGRTCGPGTAQP